MVARHVFYVKVKDSLKQVDGARKWQMNQERDGLYGEGAKRVVKRLERDGGEGEGGCFFVLCSLSLTPLLHGP